MLQVLEDLNLDLGSVRGAVVSNVLAAVALIKLGEDAQGIAKELTWGEFEDFCAEILRVSGFRVTRNIILKKPRMQIDIIAESPELVLSIDCKHWKKSAGGAVLQRFAASQVSRTVALRLKMKTDDVPIASLILTLTEETPRFVGGVAVVPLSLLRSFLNSFYEVRERLRLV
jgi:hypothetical protein